MSRLAGTHILPVHGLLKQSKIYTSKSGRTVKMSPLWPHGKGEAEEEEEDMDDKVNIGIEDSNGGDEDDEDEDEETSLAAMVAVSA